MNRRHALWIFLTIGSSGSASAGLDAKLAAKVDARRERNLPQQVIAFAKRTLVAPCIDPGDVDDSKTGHIVVDPVFSITKLGSSSIAITHSSSEFEYDATYLVVKLCPDGATMAAASLQLQTALVIRAHFESVHRKTPPSLAIVKTITSKDLPGWFPE